MGEKTETNPTHPNGERCLQGCARLGKVPVFGSQHGHRWPSFSRLPSAPCWPSRGRDGDHWRPLTGGRGGGGLGVRIGVAFRTHASPMRPHHRRGAVNSLFLAVGSAFPGANEAPKPQAIQLPKQTSGANVWTSAGQAGPAAEGLAVKFAGFTNSLVLVSSPALWSPRKGRDQPQISRMDLEPSRPPRVSAQRPDRAGGQAVLPSSLGVLGPPR